MLDWIFGEENSNFYREHVNEFLKDRFNQSLENVGVDQCSKQMMTCLTRLAGSVRIS